MQTILPAQAVLLRKPFYRASHFTVWSSNPHFTSAGGATSRPKMAPQRTLSGANPPDFAANALQGFRFAGRLARRPLKRRVFLKRVLSPTAHQIKHVIDRNSPLYGHTEESLLSGDASFSLTVMGTERASLLNMFHMQVSS
jgi:hypothetical protein